MPRNALTILRKIIDEDFKNYDIVVLDEAFDDMRRVKHKAAQVSYSMRWGAAEILLQYFLGGDIGIEVIKDLDNDRILHVYDCYIGGKNYSEMKEILYRVRDILFDCAYCGYDVGLLVDALRAKVKSY